MNVSSGASMLAPYVHAVNNQPLRLKNGAGRSKPSPRPSSMLNAVLDETANSAPTVAFGIS